MFLVRDILEEIADDVGGHGIDLDCFDQNQNPALKLFNRAQRLLMKEGDWEGTDQEICIDVREGCITLDYRIETIKQFLLNNAPGKIHNRTFKYLQSGPGALDKDHWYCGSLLEDAGDSFPLFRDLSCSMHVTAISDRPEMDTATLSIYGTDENGREASRWHSDDKGYTIPIKPGQGEYTADDGYSSGKFKHIAALSKPRTNGYVFVYGIIPGFVPVWLTTMAPDETSSRHRRYKIPGIGTACGVEMTALVSMRWVKQYPSDIALIQDIDAFKFMAKALKELDDDNHGSYLQYRNAAVSQLKKQRRKKHPAHGTRLNVTSDRQQIRNSSTKYPHNRYYGGMSGGYYGLGSLPAQSENVCQPCSSTETCTTEICETEVSTYPETAAVDIAGHRLVYLNGSGNIELADPDVAPATGLIRDSVTAGHTATVYQIGPVNGFTGLTPGANYFLGQNGIPTTTPPVTGWVQCIGTATSTTELIIDIQTPTLIE